MTHAPNHLSHEKSPSVRIAMTSTSYDLAHEAGISSIEPDLEAMEHIAHAIGFAPLRERMPSLFIVTRQADLASTQRPDDQLPSDTSSPSHARYHIAAELRCNSGLEIVARRGTLAALARNMSATALTEVSVADWRKETSHVAEFATGLLMGQRPLELAEPESTPATPYNDDSEHSGMAAAQIIDAINQNPKNWPEPFTITY